MRPEREDRPPDEPTFRRSVNMEPLLMCLVLEVSALRLAYKRLKERLNALEDRPS